MNCLTLTPLTAELLTAAVEFDQLCLGGLWAFDGYSRELDSPNSDLWVLQNGINLSPTTTSALTQPNSTLKPENSKLPLLGLACLWSIADEAHITILATHPDYRQQGLGQVLLQALLTSAWQRDLKWATLEVRVSNQAAISLYKKFGFEEVGRRKRYYQDTGEDALILWLKGVQQPEFRQTLQQRWQLVFDLLQQAGWHFSSTLPLDLGPPF